LQTTFSAERQNNWSKGRERTLENLPHCGAAFTPRLKQAEDLIELITRAAIKPEGWRDVLSRMAELLPGTKILLHAEGTRSKGNVGLIYTGFSDNSIHRYVDHYSKINPWLPCLLDMPTMVAKFSDEVLPSESFRNSEFYDGFLLREGEINHAAAVKIIHAPDRAVLVNVNYGDKVADQYNTEIKPLLQRLAPLFRMAFEVNRRLSQTLPHRELIADLIEGFLAPACLVNEHRKMLLANEAFIEEMRNLQYVAVDRFDRIKPANTCDEKKFEKMVRSAARPHDTSGPPQPLTMFLSAEDRRPASLTVLGIRAGASSGFPWLANPQSYALVLLGNPASRRPNISRDLVSKFALTPAEAALLRLVGAGENLRNAADQLGITYETARSRLKLIFAKTDLHRQAELVALMARMPW
jgi:DNA-binding CsgD family transcriptional regulator